MLNEAERVAMASFVATRGTLWSAMSKFADEQRAYYERQASDSMRTIPRQSEQAADYAAKAESYAQLMGDIERFSAKS